MEGVINSSDLVRVRITYSVDGNPFDADYVTTYEEYLETKEQVYSTCDFIDTSGRLSDIESNYTEISIQRESITYIQCVKVNSME